MICVNSEICLRCWKLWLESKNHVFNNKNSAVNCIVDFIVWTVSSWASRDKAFNGVSVHDLNISCEAFFLGGTYLKFMPSKWSFKIAF